jgi:transketolase
LPTKNYPALFLKCRAMNAPQEGHWARGATGMDTSAVSMPCWELFNARETTYRDGVFG